MLVLSRKLGEFLVLNDNIFISVFEGGVGDQVKIAIEAPEDVKIARSEMFADCEEVQKKLEAIRSRKVGKRTKRTRKEMERLGTVKTSPACNMGSERMDYIISGRLAPVDTYCTDMVISVSCYTNAELFVR